MTLDVYKEELWVGKSNITLLNSVLPLDYGGKCTYLQIVQIPK